MILQKNAEAYPEQLAEIFSAPELLYVEGSPLAWQRPCVAIVGTRRCTPYGEAVAFELGEALARAGVCVVSGLAFGIDAAAHRGALAGGGATVGVIAQGIDSLQPAKHRALAASMIERGGAVVSEKPSGMHSFKLDYLIRNRIIAGMCAITVVVEAPYRSGALNTAKHALEEGREVFAVPGRLTDVMSQGANKLLQEGAHVFLTARDVLQELDLVAEPRVQVVLSELEERLLRFIQEEPRHIGELAELVRVPLGLLFETLSELEMKGLVWRAGDQRYAVCRGR